ncbi:MAG TPA: helix-turn-helix domain-containing protein [Deltaproteobacteria bacterium]|nr:helix-turn-helix domain-containing protein [Deltaproteobacteria bacterium]
MIEALGEYLKRERELRGVSLEEIAEASKISARLLESLEADDYDSLPAPIFVKGFIRSYCRHLGLDETEAMLMYEDYLSRLSAHEERKSASAGKAAEGPRPGRPALIAVLAAAAVAALLLIYLLGSGPEPTEPVTAERPSPESARPAAEPAEEEEVGVAGEAVEPQAPPQEETEPPAAEEAAAEPGGLEAEAPPPEARSAAPEAGTDGGHTLVVNASGPVWLKIFIDDGEPFEALLRPGERIVRKASKGFYLVIGNAGGVELSFDGEPLGPLGKEGQVVRLRLPAETPGEDAGNDSQRREDSHP